MAWRHLRRILPDGRRIRRYASATTRAAVTDKLRQLQADVTAGSKPASSNHTDRAACEDWLADGLPRRSPKTVRRNKDVLEPILTAIGTTRLKELTSADVEAALAHMAGSYSTPVGADA